MSEDNPIAVERDRPYGAVTRFRREAQAVGLSLDEYLAGRGRDGVLPKIVRKWCLSELVPEAILRMRDMGMGDLTFATPTQAGNVVQVEAPAAVQRSALHDLIAIGLPTQLGIVTDDGFTLPGVIALGQFDMEAAQELAHGPRFAAAGIGPAIGGGLHESDRIGEALPPKASGGYELPPDHEMIVVDEGIGTTATTSEDRPPAPLPATTTPEQVVLARHRERMMRAKHEPVPTAPSNIAEGLRD